VTPIFLSRLHFPVQALGPGERIGIWLQGCSIRCPGCISLDTWDTGRGATTVEAILETIEPWLGKADGFTVSGGEPFEQPLALAALLRGLRRRHAGDILVYSGYRLEALDLAAFEGLIDALICDPLEVDQPQTLALRGSDNQRLIVLSALGEARFAGIGRLEEAQLPTLDLMIDKQGGEIFLAGVPRRGDLLRLAALLEAAGHKAATSEDSRLR